MGSSKNRTLFFHELDGLRRQLFFALEKKDGSLVIVLKAEDNLGERRPLREAFSGENVFRPITTSRISVHNSDNSSGMLIKHTDELADGTSETDACFISDAKARLLHPIFYKLYPDLSNDRYEVAKLPDRSVQIGSSQVSLGAALCLAVIVSDRDAELPEFNWNQKVVTKFSKYDLTTYYSFVNLVPSRNAALGIMATKKGGIGDGGVTSLEAEHLHDFLFRGFENLAAMVVSQMVSEAVPGEAGRLNSHPLWFHASAIETALGRVERNEEII